MNDDYNWDWSVDPEKIYQRLRKPCEVEGSATQMYREANQYWMDFLNNLSEEKIKEAEGNLEMVDRALQRAEIDIQKRDDFQKTIEEMEIVVEDEYDDTYE